MTPRFTAANATDWRTTEGIRVVKAVPYSLGIGEFAVTFAERFSPDNSIRGFSTYAIKSDGRFAYYQGVALVYDPVAKIDPLAPFWLVWRPHGTHPSFKHPTETSAVREAERLAKANPGTEFHVLKMTSRSRVPAVAVQTTFAA